MPTYTTEDEDGRIVIALAEERDKLRARVVELEAALRDLVTDCGDGACACCQASAPMRKRYAMLVEASK